MSKKSEYQALIIILTITNNMVLKKKTPIVSSKVKMQAIANSTNETSVQINSRLPSSTFHFRVFKDKDYFQELRLTKTRKSLKIPFLGQNFAVAMTPQYQT